MMTRQFESKVALVTGGNSGIGRAIALAFAGEGASVVIAARRTDESAQVIADIHALGGSAHFVQTDVSKVDDVKNMVASCTSKYGRLDYAINNSGTAGTPFIPTVDYDEDTWDQVIGVNLTGVFLA